MTSRNVILWVMGFGGLLLMVAAFRNEKPLDLLRGLPRPQDLTGNGTLQDGTNGKGAHFDPNGPHLHVVLPPGKKDPEGSGGTVTSNGGLPAGPASYTYDQNGNRQTQGVTSV